MRSYRVYLKFQGGAQSWWPGISGLECSAYGSVLCQAREKSCTSSQTCKVDWWLLYIGNHFSDVMWLVLIKPARSSGIRLGVGHGNCSKNVCEYSRDWKKANSRFLCTLARYGMPLTTLSMRVNICHSSLLVLGVYKFHQSHVPHLGKRVEYQSVATIIPGYGGTLIQGSAVLQPLRCRSRLW